MPPPQAVQPKAPSKAATGQGINRLAAPAVYRPQVKTAAVQQKTPAPTGMVNPSRTATRVAAVSRLPAGKPAAPHPAYRQPAGSVILRWPKGCTCHKHPHKSSCPLSKESKRAATAEHNEIHRQASAWENLKAYRSGWVKRNNITESDVQSYVGGGGKIRGHHSGDPSQGEGPNTPTDLLAFKSWYTGLHGWA